MIEELIYYNGVTIEGLLFSLAVTTIIAGLFLHYVFFPILENYGELFDKYFPLLFIGGEFIASFYFEQYMLIAFITIWAAFIKIVLNSEKYPKVNRIFDSIFLRSR